jgi:site-specific recombinase XerC
MVVPAAIACAGDTAVRRFLEFFAATIRNKNTRMAYYRAVTDFFAWLDAAGIVLLVDIEPLHVATYIETLQERMAKPTVKQHLAAIRMLFDWLVTGGILASNPATSVRGPEHVIKRGKARRAWRRPLPAILPRKSGPLLLRRQRANPGASRSSSHKRHALRP